MSLKRNTKSIFVLLFRITSIKIQDKSDADNHFFTYPPYNCLQFFKSLAQVFSVLVLFWCLNFLLFHLCSDKCGKDALKAIMRIILTKSHNYFFIVVLLQLCAFLQSSSHALFTFQPQFSAHWLDKYQVYRKRYDLLNQ